MTVEPYQEIERRANEVRGQLGLGDEPVGDIESTLEALGLSVLIDPIGADGPMGAYWPGDGLKLVFLNGSVYLPRLRFTAAHELAHHVFGDGARVDQMLEPREDATSDDVLVERRAQVFAASFLMPRAGVAARTGGQRCTPELVRDVAEHFGVSYEALAYRLQNLRLITAHERARLMAARSRVLTPEFRYQRLPEVVSLPPDYVSKALSAYEEYQISFDRLADLLRADNEKRRAELRDFLLGHDFLHPEDGGHREVKASA